MFIKVMCAIRVVCLCSNCESCPHKQEVVWQLVLPDHLICAVVTCLISQYGIPLQGWHAGGRVSQQLNSDWGEEAWQGNLNDKSVTYFSAEAGAGRYRNSELIIWLSN